jgi:hypothetical protein
MAREELELKTQRMYQQEGIVNQITMEIYVLEIYPSLNRPAIGAINSKMIKRQAGYDACMGRHKIHTKY